DDIFFFHAEDGIRDFHLTGVQTCAFRSLLGMVIGVLAGYIAVLLNGDQFIQDWIDPFGLIFINLLKLIAVPLIIFSLLNGIADLKDISKLSTMGTRTIGIYIATTIVAITVGL